MGWVERDLKDDLIPTPRYGQGHFPLELEISSPPSIVAGGGEIVLYQNLNQKF